jgi:glycerol-3-phosphate dehydrogenase
VLHAGFNVPPGSLKARLNVEGRSYFPRLSDELDVPTELCTKLVVAKNDGERRELERLLDQGRKNGAEGLSIVDRRRITGLAPGVEGKWALYSENTGIINPFLFTIALAENALANGVDIFLGTEVTGVSPNGEGSAEPGFVLKTDDGREFGARLAVNAAGLGAERVARMVDPRFPERVYPCRGEYHILDKEYSSALGLAVYPVPVKDGRGLGVHLTPTTNGNILFGPSAEYIDSPEDTSTTAGTMEQLLREAYELFPPLEGAGIIKSFAGIRPKLFSPESGVRFRDYHLRESGAAPGFFNLVGIESPGLTSAPAIASYVVNDFVSSYLRLEEKDDFVPERRGTPRTADLRAGEIRRLCGEDPEYGEIFCRCEKITKAEIRRAVDNPLGVRTLNGIKKRTHSMMGRCQSGFCLPRISRFLIDECGLDPEEVAKRGPGTEVLWGWSE